MGITAMSGWEGSTPTLCGQIEMEKADGLPSHPLFWHFSQFRNGNSLTEKRLGLKIEMVQFKKNAQPFFFHLGICPAKK